MHGPSDIPRLGIIVFEVFLVGVSMIATFLYPVLVNCDHRRKPSRYNIDRIYVHKLVQSSLILFLKKKMVIFLIDLLV